MIILTEEQIEQLVSLPSEITKEHLVDLLSKKVKRDGGKIEITPARFSITDVFTVMPKHLENVFQPIRTTVGLFLLNKVAFVPSFSKSIGYYNKTLTSGNFDNLLKDLIKLLIGKQITSDQLIKFYDKLTFLTGMAELFTPSVSTRFLYAPKEIKDFKQKLINENQDIIRTNDAVGYVTKIEKPLLEATTKYLEQDPAFELLNFNKNKYINNNFKNNCLTNGPIRDTINDKFVISTSAYSDGISPEMFHIYANSAVYGTYMRNLETRFGGAQVKYLYAALQYTKLDKVGSDCGTKITRPVLLTKDNSKFYLFRYFVENGNVKHLTRENVDDYIGKTLEFRSPLFCRSPKICNKCFNSLYFDMGIENAGLTAIRSTSTIMMIAMKAFHDVTVKVVNIDINNYMFMEK